MLMASKMKMLGSLTLGVGHTVALRMIEGSIMNKAIVQRNTFAHKKVRLSQK